MMRKRDLRKRIDDLLRQLEQLCDTIEEQRRFINQIPEAQVVKGKKGWYWRLIDDDGSTLALGRHKFKTSEDARIAALQVTQNIEVA